VFWLLLLGSAAAAVLAWRADPMQRSVRHIGIGALRVVIGVMWWQQSNRHQLIASPSRSSPQNEASSISGDAPLFSLRKF